jgi:hypothetical protein
MHITSMPMAEAMLGYILLKLLSSKEITLTIARFTITIKR